MNEPGTQLLAPTKVARLHNDHNVPTGSVLFGYRNPLVDIPTRSTPVLSIFVRTCADYTIARTLAELKKHGATAFGILQVMTIIYFVVSMF